MKSGDIVFFYFLVFNSIANAPIPSIFNLYIFLYRFLLYTLNIFSLPVFFFDIKYILLILFIFFRFDIYISNYNGVPYTMVSRIFYRHNFSLNYN